MNLNVFLAAKIRFLVGERLIQANFFFFFFFNSFRILSKKAKAKRKKKKKIPSDQESINGSLIFY